jgi:hypothetical protein
MLRDRLAARAASGKKKSKGYKPSQGTLGLAAARRAQMSHSKETSPKGYPEEVKSLAHGEVADKMAHKKSPVKEQIVNEGEPSYVKPKNKYSYLKYMKPAPGTWADTQAKKKTEAKKKSVKEDFGSGNFSTLTRDIPLKNKKKPNLSAYTPGKGLPALSAKPQMGSSNDNRMSEEVILEKSKDKSGIKRKYLGAMRGRTATGSVAHPIEVDPVIKTNSDINKVVK